MSELATNPLLERYYVRSEPGDTGNELLRSGIGQAIADT